MKHEAWKPAEKREEGGRVFPIGRVDMFSIIEEGSQLYSQGSEDERVRLIRNLHLREKLEGFIPFDEEDGSARDFWNGVLWTHKILRSGVRASGELMPKIPESQIDKFFNFESIQGKQGKELEYVVKGIDDNLHEALQPLAESIADDESREYFYMGAYIIAGVFHEYQGVQEQEDITRPHEDRLAPHFRDLEEKGALRLFTAHDIFSKN
jgi:hypothetical protein